MAEAEAKTVRIFKTVWFAKASRKFGIEDRQLCDAIRQVINGQVDDLGGGVFKKRVNKNMHRAIILANGKRHCTYVYLFAKNDRKNIEHDELDAFGSSPRATRP